MALLDEVRVACRVASTDYDQDLTDMIQEAFADIGITDVSPDVLTTTETLPLIKRAVKTYCRINFPYDGMEEATMTRLKESYDEQKAQLLMSSGYTVWGN